MRLDDLEKELYRQEQKAREHQKPDEVKASRPSWQEFPPGTPPSPPPQKPKLKMAFPKIPRWSWWAASGAVLVVSIGFILWWWFFSFPRAQVILNVEGPEEVRIGERQELTIHYENRARVPLADARLIIPLPDGITLAGDPGLKRIERNLGTVGVGGSGEEKVALRFLGQPGSTLELETKLVFRPQNLSSGLEKGRIFQAHLGPPLLRIEISSPNEVLSGQQFLTTLRYENLGTETAETARVRLDAPSLRILRVIPERVGTGPDWTAVSVAPGQRAEITVEGVMEGEEREQKTLDVEIGIVERGAFLSVSRATASITIAASPLLIAASVNDARELAVFPGDELRFKITFKNNTAVSLKEIVIRAELIGEMFDLTSLRQGSAFFDSQARALTWHGGNTPQLLALNPGEGGETTFEVKVLPTYQLSSAKRRELTILMRAAITSSSIPRELAVSELTNQTELTLPVASRLLLRSRLTFRGGARPLRVGEETIFRVSWEAVSFSNDVAGVEIKTVLPEGVVWGGNVSGNFADFGAEAPDYNERTQEIRWQIARLPAGSGISEPAPAVSFDIKARPSLQHVGRPLPLLDEISVEGQDTFAKVGLVTHTQPSDSSLPDDPSWNPKDGEVRP